MELPDSLGWVLFLMLTNSGILDLNGLCNVWLNTLASACEVPYSSNQKPREGFTTDNHSAVHISKRGKYAVNSNICPIPKHNGIRPSD
jgi:hypothetical protein